MRLDKARNAANVHAGDAPHSGYICLSMLLAFKKVTSEPRQLMNEFSPTGDVEMMHLVRAAKKMGLKAKARTCKFERLDKLPLPAVALGKDGDYFVLASCRGERALLQVPGEAPKELTRDQLSEIWSGEALFATTRLPIETEERPFDLRWFIPAIVKYRKLFGEVILASLFTQVIALASPLFFQVVVDKVLVHQSLNTLDVLAFGMLAIVVFDILLNGLRTFIFSHTTSRVDVELGARLFDHLVNLPLGYFEKRPVGQTVARVRELDNIRDFLTGSSVTVLIDTFFTAIFFAIMYYYSKTLFWIVVASIPFFIILSLWITPSLRNRIEEKFQRGAVNQSFLTETVTGIETLKAMSIEPQMRHRWEEQLAAYVRAGFRTVVISTLGSQGVQLISKVVMVAILWVGATEVIAGNMTVGQLIAFNMFASQVNGPIIRLAQLWQDFQQMRISVARLGDILNSPTEPGHDASKPVIPPIKGHIAFDRVSFRYEPNRPEVVRDLSLTIEPGEVIGIVGRSGSGKSTLTKLVQRMYLPERGRVLIDGSDIALIDPALLRRQIGVVLQESVLFRASVRENIGLSNPSMPLERVVAAAQSAGAHDFILEMKDGYNTILEERGSNLSGGQRQRIAIARALAANPPVLIFDEATSALDYESERIIQENMRSICAGRTVLIVAHRLSTVRRADKIVVLEKGAIAEQGSHEDLLALGQSYANLYRQQVG